MDDLIIDMTDIGKREREEGRKEGSEIHHKINFTCIQVTDNKVLW